MIVDLSDVVDELTTGEYLVTRGGVPVEVRPGQYERPLPAPAVLLPMQVVPLQGRALRELPEGELAEDYREALLRGVVYVADPRTGRTSDMVEVDDELYYVKVATDARGLAGFTRATFHRYGR